MIRKVVMHLHIVIKCNGQTDLNAWHVKYQTEKKDGKKSVWVFILKYAQRTSKERFLPSLVDILILTV